MEHRRKHPPGVGHLRVFALMAVLALLLAACTTAGSSDTTDTTPGSTASTDQGTSDTTSSDGATGGVLTIGLGTEPSSLDPADGLFIPDHTVMLNIYDPLIWTDQNGDLQPGLATAWSVDDGGTSFTFTLREDVIFHDGTPFNAEAVKAQFDRISTITDGIGAALTILGGYEESVVAGNTVTVTFSSPKPEFLSDLSRMWMGIPSPTAVAEMGDDFDRSPVGTGPFVFEEWAAQESITLSRNDDYAWGRGFAGDEGPAGVESLVFRILPDGAARLAAFQSGEVDVIEDPPFQEVAAMVEADEAALVSFQAPGMPAHMMLNTEKAPTDDALVREAMIRAINTEELSATAFAGLQTPVTNVVSPTTFAYSEEAGSMYGYDPELAAELLESAGWIDGDGDGVREKDGVTLSVFYPASSAYESDHMELFAAYLSAVGFQVDLQQMDDAGIFEVASAGEHNVVNMGWISSSPSVLSFVYHSSTIDGGSGFTRFRDPALDAALDSAAGAVDSEERAAFYEEVQRIIMENALAIPLYSYDRVMLLQPDVSGWQFDSEGYPWLTQVTLG